MKVNQVSVYNVNTLPQRKLNSNKRELNNDTKNNAPAEVNFGKVKRAGVLSVIATFLVALLQCGGHEASKVAHKAGVDSVALLKYRIDSIQKTSDQVVSSLKQKLVSKDSIINVQSEALNNKSKTINFLAAQNKTLAATNEKLETEARTVYTLADGGASAEKPTAEDFAEYVNIGPGDYYSPIDSVSDVIIDGKKVTLVPERRYTTAMGITDDQEGGYYGTVYTKLVTRGAPAGTQDLPEQYMSIVSTIDLNPFKSKLDSTNVGVVGPRPDNEMNTMKFFSYNPSANFDNAKIWRKGQNYKKNPDGTFSQFFEKATQQTTNK